MRALCLLSYRDTHIINWNGQKGRGEEREKEGGKAEREGRGGGEKRKRGWVGVKSFRKKSAGRLWESPPFVEINAATETKIIFSLVNHPQIEGEVWALSAESTWGKKSW